MYEFSTRIRYSEVDGNQKLTYLGLIDLFQSCSTFQSEDLGIGVDYLFDHNEGWVVVSYHIVMDYFPKLSDEVYVQTWATKLNGAFGYRNFALTDKDHNRIAYASSLWIMMDFETARPKRISSDIIEKYDIESPIEEDSKRHKITVPKEYTSHEPIKVLPYFLDTNKHVNNGKYIMVSTSYLPDDFKPKEFYVEYRNQAYENDLLYPRCGWENNHFVVSLCNRDGVAYTIMEFIA